MEKTVRFNLKEKILKTKSIIEFQAFRGCDNEFIVKELVILDLATGVQNYFLFKPPYKTSRLNRKAIKTNKWCSRNYHYISWDEGFINYEELDNIMYHYCAQYDIIFSRGVDKCNWISMYTTSRVIDFNICKEIKRGNISFCIGVKDSRHKVFNCALRNAYELALSIDASECCGGGNNNGGGSVSGGGSQYKYELEAATYHEYYSNLREGSRHTALYTMSSQNLQTLTDLFNTHSKSSLLATRKCSELKEERRYIVHTFRRIDTSVGDGIIAALSEAPYKDGDRARFQIFLPKRFVSLLQNEDFSSIKPGSLYIVSHGSSGNNSTELSLHVNES